eukprot:TRINITY_DN1056_c0_g1_i3.p1 TRINITY_DN1056_c0_g1~~TRINITY_DN1056_c0_g1_i3.p1  ORF type:complete len:209 (+),score=37.50 TRINITY_DN1056_c0_g1_i3:82-627(+)
MAGVPPDIVPRVVKLANHGVVRTFSSTGGWGVAVDNNDGAHAYVAYSIKNMVARVSLRDGSAVCVAGIPSSEGFHDGAGSEGLMYWPSGIAVHRSGDIYFCDECNNAIRKITPQGELRTVAGNRSKSFCDGSGSAASFFWPRGLAINTITDELIVADSDNNCLRLVTTAGTLTYRHPPYYK